MGRQDIGSLEIGKCADFCAINTNQLEYAGAIHDPDSQPRVEKSGAIRQKAPQPQTLHEAGSLTDGEKQAATVDTLLQAEVSWNQAEVAYTAAVFEGRIAQALLRRALGDFAEWLEAKHE